MCFYQKIENKTIRFLGVYQDEKNNNININNMYNAYFNKRYIRKRQEKDLFL